LGNSTKVQIICAMAQPIGMSRIPHMWLPKKHSFLSFSQMNTTMDHCTAMHTHGVTYDATWHLYFPSVNLVSSLLYWFGCCFSCFPYYCYFFCWRNVGVFCLGDLWVVKVLTYHFFSLLSRNGKHQPAGHLRKQLRTVWQHRHPRIRKQLPLLSYPLRCPALPTVRKYHVSTNFYFICACNFWNEIGMIVGFAGNFYDAQVVIGIFFNYRIILFEFVKFTGK